MIGFKALTGGLAGMLLVGGAAMADAAPERATCLRGAGVMSWAADGVCGPVGRGGNHRRVLRPVLGAIGHSPAPALRSAPVRFTSLLILGVGY